MPSPREILNKLRYTGQPLADVEVTYIHRGAPNDVRIVRGDEIRGIDRPFLRLHGPRGGASIPWHRVVLVRRGEDVLFRRRAD